MKLPFFAGCLVGAIGLFATLILVGLVFKGQLIKNKTDQLHPAIEGGGEAVYTWQVESLDGSSFDMAQTKGKALFLNFWRPSCMSCLAELPTVNGLYHQVAGENVVFMSIALDNFDELPFLVEDAKLDFPVFKSDASYPEEYHLTKTPTTLIIAPNGAIVFRHEGAARWDVPGAVALLKSLASEPAPASP
ncbi:MAG: TlpA family protein disulfide reductase [Candidatus Hydrogenedentes bacterium]|nr:TlpA family protein disulfide reductase [Candidatus Hydrogenedentota bacterium]